MHLKFYKYQGTGNDFILFDNRDLKIRRNNNTWFAQICDRRFGIGADGVMLLQNAEGADFEMVYYNADGGESSMCGNGGRCMINFAKSIGIEKERYRFKAADGMHEGYVEDEIVYLKMGDVKNVSLSPVYCLLNTGSPHYVQFVSDTGKIKIREEGAAIRYSEPFKEEGVNVNFVQMLGSGIRIRTYERGVEDETLSCGTGVTAAAIALAAQNNYEDGHYDIPVETMGGKLVVSFDKKGKEEFENVWLIGPGAFVFAGEVDSAAANNQHLI